MRYQLMHVRSVALRARLLDLLIMLMIVLAASASLAPSDAIGGTQQTAGPSFGIDDRDSVSLNPYPSIAVSTIGSIPPGQCAWINTGLAAFSAANPSDPTKPATDGTGPSGQGWTFTWAGVAAEAQIEAGIKIIDYYPWVNNEPGVYSANPNRPDGFYAGQGNLGDAGGAVLNLSYTPQPGAPALTNLDWVQGLTGTLRGVNIPTGLDNFTNFPTSNNRDMSSPFYDGGLNPGTAGTIAGGGGWFLDTPFATEGEYEMNPTESVQFQVILTSDVKTRDANGVTQNAVTLYGGVWWGFNYTTTEGNATPEPSTYALMASGAIGLLLFRCVRGRKSAI
jgi:hypothetical protein